eukprot:tig00021245_g19601.t1
MTDATDSYTETGKYVIQQQVTPTDIYYGKEVPIADQNHIPAPAADEISWTRDPLSESFSGVLPPIEGPKSPSSPERTPAPGAAGEWAQEGASVTTTENEVVEYAAAQPACSGTGPCFPAQLYSLSLTSATPLADLSSFADDDVQGKIEAMLLGAYALDTNLEAGEVVRTVLPGTAQSKDVQTIPYTLKYDQNTHSEFQRTVEEKGTFTKTMTGTISGVGPYTFLDGGFNIGQYAKPGLEVGRYEVHAREDRESTTKTSHTESEAIKPIQTPLPGGTELPEGLPALAPTSKIVGTRGSFMVRDASTGMCLSLSAVAYGVPVVPAPCNPNHRAPPLDT